MCWSCVCSHETAQLQEEVEGWGSAELDSKKKKKNNCVLFLMISSALINVPEIVDVEPVRINNTDCVRDKLVFSKLLFDQLVLLL